VLVTESHDRRSMPNVSTNISEKSCSSWILLSKPEVSHSVPLRAFKSPTIAKYSYVLQYQDPVQVEHTEYAQCQSTHFSSWEYNVNNGILPVWICNIKLF